MIVLCDEVILISVCAVSDIGSHDAGTLGSPVAVGRGRDCSFQPSKINESGFSKP